MAEMENERDLMVMFLLIPRHLGARVNQTRQFIEGFLPLEYLL